MSNSSPCLLQYLYLYDCLFEYYLGRNRCLSDDLKSKFKLMSRTNPDSGSSQLSSDWRSYYLIIAAVVMLSLFISGQSFFRDEFVQLDRFTPLPTKDELRPAAELDANQKKNRYP